MYGLILIFLGITIWTYSQLGICRRPKKLLKKKIDENFFSTNILCRHISFLIKIIWPCPKQGYADPPTLRSEIFTFYMEDDYCAEPI